MNTLRLILLCSCILAFGMRAVDGQGLVDALTIQTNLYVPRLDYIISGGIGWHFVPTQDIIVKGIEASAPQVSFWQGSNQVLATYNVSNPSFIPSGSFEPIAPLLLYAGQSYFVSSQNANFSGNIETSSWGLLNVAFPPPIGPAPFEISSYLGQYGSYFVSPIGQWSPKNIDTPFGVPYTASLLYGPNFQFQSVPEPSVTCYSVLGLLFWFLSLRSGFKELQNA